MHACHGTQVILWPYPDTDRIPIALSTEHRQNLFGVKLLPATNNRRIVTGAMDNSVQMHELDAAPQPQLPGGSRRGSSRGGASSSNGGVDGEGGASWRGGGGRAGMRRHGVAPPLQRVQPRTTVYGCHRSRVKVRLTCCRHARRFCYSLKHSVLVAPVGLTVRRIAQTCDGAVARMRFAKEPAPTITSCLRMGHWQWLIATA